MCPYCKPDAPCLICQLGDPSPRRAVERLTQRFDMRGSLDGTRKVCETSSRKMARGPLLR